MNVLIACEYSGTVRRAFEKQGHYAVSCDLLESEDKTNLHHKGDVLEILDACNWDLMIAHPPCTFMCNSGVSWLHKDDSRWDKLKEAKEFFYKLWNCNIPRICIENPIPHKYAELPKYSQIIQPYEFGHPERKATCLWLKNLPLLEPTNNVKEIMEKLPKKEAQRIHYTSPGKDRWKIRSRTFQGIAEAMANQWSKQLLTLRGEGS